VFSKHLECWAFGYFHLNTASEAINGFFARISSVLTNTRSAVMEPTVTEQRAQRDVIMKESIHSLR
jgi:hypothetical protein